MYLEIFNGRVCWWLFIWKYSITQIGVELYSAFFSKKQKKSCADKDHDANDDEEKIIFWRSGKWDVHAIDSTNKSQNSGNDRKYSKDIDDWICFDGHEGVVRLPKRINIFKTDFYSVVDFIQLVGEILEVHLQVFFIKFRDNFL